MRKIVIVSDDKEEKIGLELYRYFSKISKDVDFISASDSDIKPQTLSS